MKKKITFRDACAVWLQEQRRQNNLKTSNVNNALRVSYFACFVSDDVTKLTGDAINAIWDAFVVRWLGTEEELNFCSSYLRLCLIHIGQIMNDHNSGKKKVELPVGLESVERNLTVRRKERNNGRQRKDRSGEIPL